MFKSQIEQINKDIKRTKKAIVALGCSFVQGAGAFNKDVYKNYSWDPLTKGEHLNWNLTDADQKRLISQYPEININPGSTQPNLSLHQANNAFVNVLCKKYFNGDYAAINFGIDGSGNRATIKELHYYPDILWDEIEECIVIFCPSGPERMDFIDDQSHDPNSHNRWKSMWPRELSETGPRADLWRGYKNHLYSAKFETLEQIAIIQELLLWCKYKNAQLIITPAFSHGYDKDIFRNNISLSVRRDGPGNIISQYSVNPDNDVDTVVNMWPWDNMFNPDQCPSFIDLAMKQEFPTTWKDNEHFYEYHGMGTPNMWVTPCAHPSAEAHDLFAQHLHRYITGNKK
jgi:hypothetical protein